jgi:hypothetical protein
MAGRSTDNANIVTHDLTWEHPNTIETGGNSCEVQTPPFICVTTPLGFAIDPDRRTPYMYQFMLNVQRQLSLSTVLEAGYLGVFGHGLQGQTLPGMAVPGPEPIVQRNPYPAFSTVDIVYGNGRSNYHSATLKLNRRLSSGVAVLLSYTYSKSLDYQSGITPESGYHPNQPQNGWCRVPCEYGYSDFDTRHRLVISSLYELPFGRGKRFLNAGVASAIVGGWQLNNIFSFSTGFPLTIRVGANYANVTYGIQRPDVVAGTPWKLDNPTPDQWFNLRSMTRNKDFAYGNMQRNAIIGPGIAAWDFSTLKNFNFTERAYLQFRFECFNCANHPVWADPGTVMSTSRFDSNGFAIPGTGVFGKVTNTRTGIDMRKLQFSLKFYF